MPSSPEGRVYGRQPAPRGPRLSQNERLAAARACEDRAMDYVDAGLQMRKDGDRKSAAAELRAAFTYTNAARVLRKTRRLTLSEFAGEVGFREEEAR